MPAPGAYAVGMVFLPVEKHNRLQCEGIFERIVREEGLSVLGWRDTPVNGDAIGREARVSQPYIQQISSPGRKKWFRTSSEFASPTRYAADHVELALEVS